MSQPSLFQLPFWTVTELTLYLRDLLQSDELLQDLWVQGEISNLSRPQSGHLYFTLKDSTSALKVVMWRSTVQRQAFLPQDGQAVEVHGSLGIYEAQGQYQLYADLMRPAGEGILFQQFLRLKAQLEDEGLFDPERKRPIPRWPHRIGLITSPTGAALRDILNTLARRYPLAEVFLASTPVQGAEAPPAIISALQTLNQAVNPDVILLARGGGSIEDLWAFNDERVARAIAASTAPVITGVGHETDFTIADFVSDLRAPTPTAAAELATPDRADLRAALSELSARLERALQSFQEVQRRDFVVLSERLSLRSPLARIRTDRQRLDELAHRSEFSIQTFLQYKHAALSGLRKNLYSLNPLSVLRRGYAILTQPGGLIVRSIAQAKPGDVLDARLQDGRLSARVADIHKDSE